MTLTKNRRLVGCIGVLILCLAAFGRGAGKSDVADAAMRGDKTALRGLLQPGLNADIMVFDPDTVGPLDPEEAPDLPSGAIRRKQLSHGIAWTIVNGEVLIDHGEHTGALPGCRVRAGRE